MKCNEMKVNYCYSFNEKMGVMYVHDECGNTLTACNYKQPQAVIYELSESNRNADGVGLSETRNARSDQRNVCG